MAVVKINGVWATVPDTVKTDYEHVGIPVEVDHVDDMDKVKGTHGIEPVQWGGDGQGLVKSDTGTTGSNVGPSDERPVSDRGRRARRNR